MEFILAVGVGASVVAALWYGRARYYIIYGGDE